jgi:glycosyltransferase involved in cell wall biosynthesis
MLSSEGETPLLIVNFSGRGGFAHHIYFLCDALARQGVDFVLLTTRDFELARQCAHFRCERALFSHHRFNSKVGKGIVYGISLLILLFYILKLKPRVLHLQESRIPSLEKRLLQYFRKRGIKIVFNAHDIANTDSGAVAATAGLQELYGLFDHVVAHTEQNKKTIAEAFQVDARRISMLPVGEYALLTNGYLDQNVARKALGISSERQIMLFFGYIRQYKGLRLLLEALARVRQSLPNIFLIIAGEAKEDFSAYREHIDANNLGNIVHTDIQYIPLDQMATYFGAADVVVLPYLRVFQSGLVRLAYAYQKPVIATRVGDLPMVVEHGKTGYLIPPDSVEGLVEAIKLAFGDSKLLHEMGKYARLRTGEKFSWEQFARELGKIYGQVVTS